MSEKVKMHFSHRHPLCASEIQDDEDLICSGCEHDLSSGLAYKCVKPNCDFHLHDFCFELPQEIQHNSHPNHPLTLLSTPPYQDGEFACNACSDFGTCFMYHCPRCQFDLHVQCATLPETVEIQEHEHPLVLFYSFPSKGNDAKRVICGVCNESFPQTCWVYYCRYCDYVAHLDCASSDIAEEYGDEVV